MATFRLLPGMDGMPVLSQKSLQLRSIPAFLADKKVFVSLLVVLLFILLAVKSRLDPEVIVLLVMAYDLIGSSNSFVHI